MDSQGKSPTRKAFRFLASNEADGEPPCPWSAVAGWPELVDPGRQPLECILNPFPSWHLRLRSQQGSPYQTSPASIPIHYHIPGPYTWGHSPWLHN